MKSFFSKIVFVTLFSGFVLSGMIATSQNPIYRCVAKNDTLLDDRNYRFDIYIYKDPSSPYDYYLPHYSIAFKIENTAAILNGGTLTASMVPGSSQLYGWQPSGAAIWGTPTTFHYLRVIGPPATFQGLLIPLTGRRVGTFKITNSVPFGQAPMNLIWNYNPPAITAIRAIPYPWTQINDSVVSGTGVVITTYPEEDIIELTNPILNPSVPILYSMTSTGPVGPSGNTFNLSGSQTGVKYCLMKNNVPVAAEMDGTGSPLMLGTVTDAGTYSCRARLPATYIENSMNGTINIRNLHVKCFLEGLYNGSGGMRKAQGELGDQFPGTVADKVSLCLKDAAPPYNTIFSAGDLDLNTDGNVSVKFAVPASGSYYLTIRNRNHSEAWSALPLSLNPDDVYYDFTDDASKTYGGNLKNDNGKFLLWSGDVITAGTSYPATSEPDGMLNMDDEYYIYDSYNHGDFGYFPMDLNGDGMINQEDLYLQYFNYLQGVYTVTP